MKRDGEQGVTRRERLEVIGAALIPAGLGLLGGQAAIGGRLAWLAPVAALPFGIGLCWLWGKVGGRDLGSGLEAAFGTWLGRGVQLLYLMWGLFLLAGSARRYGDRLLTVFEGETVRWLFLGTALAVALWLGRGNGPVFARTGRIFLLAVLVMLGFVLLLALPGVDWRNLWPPERGDLRGLPKAAALALSLSGYGVYGLCLSQGQEETGESWPWAVWGCGIFAAVLLAVTGVFGPALAERMEEPFLYLLEGVQVPGAFRRGEAALIAVLALGDLALLALLTRGCRSLWLGAVPVCRGRGGWLLVAGAILSSGSLPGGSREILAGGNLIFGVLFPGLAVLVQGIRTTFSGAKKPSKADVAAEKEEKKSCEENEKKC